MTDFPDPHDWNLVVARLDDAGEPDFFVGEKPITLDMPGIVKGGFYWRADDGYSRDNPGGVPTTYGLAGPNGSTFGVTRFAANSAGKLDVRDAGWDDDENTGQGGDAAMHASDTIDYEVVLSGKIDLELPGGKVHTLVPGDLLVMAGVAHAWKNPYDEDCLFLMVNVGYDPTS